MRVRVILSALCLPALCLAASVAWTPSNPFIGEWKLIPSRSRMPDEMKIRRKGNSTYDFDFGGSVETIIVDGSEQPGVGGTLLSVKPEAPDTWIVRRRNGGRLLLQSTWKLSADGGTLNDYYRGFDTDGSTFSVDYVYQRTRSGSGFSADWQSVRETINSPYRLAITTYQDDGLSIVDPVARRTKNLRFDGKYYPPDAPTAAPGVSSSIRRVNDRTLVITNKSAGKLASTEELALSADMKILTLTVDIVGRDKPFVLAFERR